jgi:hypothetical protein
MGPMGGQRPARSQGAMQPAVRDATAAGLLMPHDADGFAPVLPVGWGQFRTMTARARIFNRPLFDLTAGPSALGGYSVGIQRPDPIHYLATMLKRYVKPITGLRALLQ